jgi:hypothetical protein
MDQLAAEADDENQLDQVVDHQTEKTVQIFANEPWMGGVYHRGPPGEF